MDKRPDAPTRTIRLSGKTEVLVFRKYRLVVQESPGGKQDKAVEDRHATIGTAASNAVVLADPSVSRAHCEITVDDRGYLLRDLDSKNGTAVDGLRVIAAYLRPKSVLTLGDTRIQFVPESEDVEVPIAAGDRLGRLIGASLEMRALYATLEKVAGQAVTVLIEGESGSGKDLVAQEIHDHSPRKEEPFVVFDCGAVPENLVESELFGHVKGAFTGATADRAGAFELADGGTLFLDEIGELAKEIQPKLLRVLESQEIRAVGSSRPVKCDVRIVAATNRDLSEEVKRGAFREDLFFRLNVVRVRVPPLRHRREDIPALIEHLLSRGAARGRKSVAKDPSKRSATSTAITGGPAIPPDTLAMLATYTWPGNVRELRNFVERYLVFAPADLAGAATLLTGAGDDEQRAWKKSGGLLLRFDLPFKEAKSCLVEVMEAQYCKRLLERHKGNVSAAAREAGIHRKYLEILVRKHALK